MMFIADTFNRAPKLAPKPEVLYQIISREDNTRLFTLGSQKYDDVWIAKQEAVRYMANYPNGEAIIVRSIPT